MRHLVLHAGAHKTGTTLVQKALQANREAFARKGYEAMVRNDYEFATDRVHSLWRRHGLDISNVNRGFATLRSQLQHENLVLSHEDLLASVDSFRAGPIYGTAADVLRIAHEELRPEHTTLVFYVRRQDRFVESSYLQTVRVGSTRSFEEFIEPIVEENLRWDVLIDQMRAALPEGTDIKIKYFETIKTLKSRAFVRDFFAATGVGVTAKFPFNTQGVNRGYSDVALQLALVGNAMLENEDSRTLRHFLDSNFSNVTHPAPRLFTPEQRQDLLSALVPSNKALHDKIGADGSSPYLPGSL